MKPAPNILTLNPDTEFKKRKHRSPKTEFKKGHKFSKEMIEKMRKAKLGKKFPNRRRSYGPLSEETKRKMSEAHRGEKAYQWKGGQTLNLIIRRCFQYRQWRSDIFTRDDFTCQFCGLKGVYLEAHHIKSFSKIIEEYQIKTLEEALNCEELWNINNGRTLCKKCHDRTKIQQMLNNENAKKHYG